MKLSPDGTFHFNLLRWLGTAPYRGVDVAEMLDVADRIVAGDVESWHDEFLALAQHVEAESSATHSGSPITVRDRAFRAASYYRAADFFLHGTPSDPRIASTWVSATEQFNQAIAHLTPAGERLTIQADGFTIPAIFYRAADDRLPRPTILMFNGFDGSQEEMLHISGFAALERGFNILTFEGPGQPTVVREQRLGFRHDWEHVVSPVVDHCQRLAEIDAGRLALLGLSFGGYLAPRAAAFEPRIRAVAAIDGLFDGHEAVRGLLNDELKTLFDRQDVDAFNAAMRGAMLSNGALRWYIEQGVWSFRVTTPYEFFDRSRAYTLEGVAQRITCPVLVCRAAGEHFNPGQAEKLAAALGDRATVRSFTAEESAAYHSHIGAFVFMNGVVLDWIASVLSVSQTNSFRSENRRDEQVEAEDALR
ncbi:MAG TPA: alpha/beta fold hydrolase [Vicinamibacterales bacterium]|nr:alpha/beta fold hydrolase [Vicinamibacterales bacterium]